MIAVLSGGTGTPKLLQGMMRLMPPEEISVIVNTGDDTKVSGLHVSPDLDTVVYTLAGIVNERTWWGIKGDTFETYKAMKRLGWKELLKIGDKDRATNIIRTMMLDEGKSLSEATAEICRAMGVRSKVMPMSDDPVQTVIHTDSSPIGLQEYLVRGAGSIRVQAVSFKGSGKAKPAPGVLKALNESEAIIIGPSNPITSIGPILAIKKIKRTLSKRKSKVIAVSPLIGNSPVSGPAGALMRALGYEVSPRGVAEVYREVIGTLLIHPSDGTFRERIEELGIRVVLEELLLPDLRSRIKLASTILRLAGFKVGGRL